MLLPIVIGAAALGFVAMKRRRGCHSHPMNHGRGCGGGRRHGRRWRGGLYWALARLGATPAQEKVIREEINKLRELGFAARGEAFAARGDLAEALRGESLEQGQLDAAIGRVDGAYASFKASIVDSLTRLHATLDGRQREQIADFLGEKRGTGSGPFRT